MRATSRAAQDLADIAGRIAADNPQAAIAFLDAVQSTEALVAKNPEIGEKFPSVKHPRVRRILVSGFRNYVLYYQVNPGHLLQVRLLHAARDQSAALDA